ncbi:MAG: oligosaccharide flippase family protein [Microcoleaceae cyanobacterium]
MTQIYMKKLLSKLDWSYFYAFIGEATLALTFAFYIILARVLGPEDYGVFAAAVALAAVLSLFIQFGLTNLLLREVAANPETGPRLTIQCLLVELISAGGVLLFLFPLASILGYQDRELLVCYLAVLSEVGRAAIMTLRNVAKGEGWFRAESIAVAIERAAVMLVACFVLYQTENLVLVMLTVVAVRFLDALGLFYFLNRKLDLWSPISGQGLWKLTQAAYPFAMSGVLWIIYYQVDVVMLNELSTEAET